MSLDTETGTRLDNRVFGLLHPRNAAGGRGARFERILMQIMPGIAQN
jgi:hypothetical protein